MLIKAKGHTGHVTFLVLTVVGLTCVLSTCGGDDDDSAAPATKSTTTTTGVWQRRRKLQPLRKRLPATTEASDGTEDVTAEANRELLGENWTGNGTYTVVRACKAYNADDDFTAYVARITAAGFEDGLTLFWRLNGQAMGDGLLTGDTVTREFSVWGAAANADHRPTKRSTTRRTATKDRRRSRALSANCQQTIRLCAGAARDGRL